jgi:hypothetical protein
MTSYHAGRAPYRYDTIFTPRAEGVSKIGLRGRCVGGTASADGADRCPLGGKAAKRRQQRVGPLNAPLGHYPQSRGERCSHSTARESPGPRHLKLRVVHRPHAPPPSLLPTHIRTRPTRQKPALQGGRETDAPWKGGMAGWKPAQRLVIVPAGEALASRRLDARPTGRWGIRRGALMIQMPA